MPNSWFSKSHCLTSCKHKNRIGGHSYFSGLCVTCNTRYWGTGILHLERVKIPSFSAKVEKPNRAFHSKFQLFKVRLKCIFATWRKWRQAGDNSGMTLLVTTCLFLTSYASTWNSNWTFLVMIICFLLL